MERNLHILTRFVRDLLWERAVRDADDGRVTQARAAASEQGFAFRIHGDQRRSVVDFDGMKLVSVKLD